ncbi:hypothetical protein JIQ42_02772 [Leishmania sp. Namibia]|uniref:hypothetical protein n=1 Tax=Leishmania sp. Namibia TaxID=2802991 RepID=UPI001B65625F|nr:hypothetical protein JIQ42_02772 [Leishmania sp. Namibia]
MVAQRKGIMGFFKEAGYNPSRWLPSGVALTERSTGKTMGWHGDVIGELNNISREDQEALAVASHANAARAEKAGYFSDEIVPVMVDAAKNIEVKCDDVLQRDTEKMKAKMPSLKPVFRKDKGTITAATSSALTDGGSAMLVMSEEKAKKLGYPTDVSVKSWYFCGIDPYPQLLLAPVLGWGPALERRAWRRRTSISTRSMRPSQLRCSQRSSAYGRRSSSTDMLAVASPFSRKTLTGRG